MNSEGRTISTGGFLPGSELTWLGIWAQPGMPAFIEQFFKYDFWGYTAGPQWKYTAFDFDRDYKRLGLAPWYDNSNPDLRKFKRAGGKLILYEGGNDTVDVPGPVIDYYETVERTMGGRAATQGFFRLFLIPGMNHCTGGDGAYAIDYLSSLEAWVEHGRPPERLIGAHVSDSYLAQRPNRWGDWAKERANRIWAAAFDLKFPLDPKIPIAFTRPVYPSPVVAKYLGRGDPNDAASFGPAPH